MAFMRYETMKWFEEIICHVEVNLVFYNEVDWEKYLDAKQKYRFKIVPVDFWLRKQVIEWIFAN